ncbi:hypothetical protein EHS13_13700 [Paenibacillus psychroresistens]|uniref:Terminase small subunit n=1 Tax=Paenibacillus psychroresistens TaxID=1778678 RepID=A0A6B8RJR2_9BACL|nr:hypothetical protein [Paenibacillus psychroresistens]QGQ95855.1 hypothetical protein EHS13_13700 [Paenibacillus psychroresistens]
MPKEKAKEVQFHEAEVLTNMLAQIVGKTPQWIRQLTRDRILMQVGRGRYILGESVQAYIQHVSGGKETDNKPRFIDEKTAHERIKKEKATLELELMRGDLHATKDIEKLMTEMILTVKAKLQVIAFRLAPQLENETELVIETAISNEINEALKGLSEYSPTLFVNQDEPDD